MRKSDFDEQIYKNISLAKDFFVIIEKDSLQACFNGSYKRDWFCKEIMYAIQQKKNIIPMLIDGCKMPSEDSLPPEMKDLAKKNALEFSFLYFDEYIEKLIKRGYITSSVMEKEKNNSVLKFFSNNNCDVYESGKLICSLEAGNETPFYYCVTRKGNYEFVCKIRNSKKRKTILVDIDEKSETIVYVKWRKYKRFVIGVVCLLLIVLFGITSYLFFECQKEYKSCKTICQYRGYMDKKDHIFTAIYKEKASRILKYCDSLSNKIQEVKTCHVSENITVHKLEALTKIMSNMVYFNTNEDANAKSMESFFMNKYEVSRGEWEAIMNDSTDSMPLFPKASISRKEAFSFIDSLNVFLGLDFRLPYKKEWEYAARAGINNDPYRFSGSDNIDLVAWYAENSNDQIHSNCDTSQEHLPNSCNMFNMSGNVSEWCLDTVSIFGDYVNIQLKGGNFLTNEIDKLSIENNESFMTETDTAATVGFRLLLVN